MLYNLIRFVEWPAGAIEARGSRLTIGVWGEDPVIRVLRTMLHDKTAGGHPIVIRRLDVNDRAGDCLVVFVGDADRTEIARILHSVGSAPVLTVGEDTRFLRLGGMVAFDRDGGRTRFEVNLAAAERAGLHLSSKLLQLASIFRVSAPRVRD